MVFIGIQTNIVQNWLVGLATSKLSTALGTEVKIKNVSLSLFNRLNIEGALIRDKQKDTLLYAGQLKVRITDWFFFKDKAVLKYIGLEEAVIKIERKDSIWNYAFIENHFGSPTPSSKKDGKLELNFKNVDLKNIHFLKNDRWAGEKMDIVLGSFKLDAELVDLKKSNFVINSLSLDKPLISIQQLKALRPTKQPIIPKLTTKGLYLNEANISLTVSNLTIRSGSLFLDSDLDKPITLFDVAHIHLTKLNGTIKNISFIKDTLKANIHIAMKERCGLELKKLTTVLKFTPQIIELSQMDLQTNNSRITNYYAMQFTDFNKDFREFEKKVVMKAQFANAKISSNDIAYFSSDLKKDKGEILLSGSFLGTVENFSVPNLTAKIGSNTRIDGSLRLRGLPNINKTNIEFQNGTLQTNSYDLGSFFPDIKNITSPNLSALGNIIYRGNFNGRIQKFITNGVFSTQLGGLKTNISMYLPNKSTPEYTGALETTRFNLGKFLNDENLGLVDFNGKITGIGFKLDKLKTSLEGVISSLEYNGYTYQNIVTNGTFQKKYFTGEVKINDPNLDFTSTVEIDLTHDLPSFNILGDFVHSNFKELNLLKDPIEFTGLLDVNFSGKNIDNFQGNAKVFNAKVKNGRHMVSFDSLNLSSGYVNGEKYLQLGSVDINATITGNFSIIELPASFQALLTNYYPTYVKQPKFIPENQLFNFNITTQNIEPYLQLIDNKIAGFNNASLQGSIDTRNRKLSLAAIISTGKYDKFSFNGLALNGKGSNDTLSLIGNINSIEINKEFRIPETKLAIVSTNDQSLVSISTSLDTTTTIADISAQVNTLTDGAIIKFLPSSFILNEKKWSIEKEGKLTLRTNFINAENIKFTQGFEEIRISSIPGSKGSNNTTLFVNLSNVVLSSITSLFFKDPRLEGITSGEIRVEDLTGDLFIKSDLSIAQFRFDDDSIGIIKIKAGFESKTGNIPFAVESPNEDYLFSAMGSYNSKDTTGKSFSTTLNLTHTKINFLHKFLGDIFSDINGKVMGKLTISGDLNAPTLLGKISLHNAGMRVNYSQVYYSIDSAEIAFTNEGINFGQFTIHDRFKNSGLITGKLGEKGFKNMYFDFELSTNKLLLIDTKATDNQQFYGNAIGKANLKMKGPETDARLTIVGESNDSSHIYIPNSVSRESGNADFIVFKQYGTEMLKSDKKSAFNLNVDLTITATNKVMIDVIMDEISGDVIRAVGTGTLKIKAGTNEPLSILGRYSIEKGNYIFNFQGLLKKPFVLLPNSGNYIEWKGDPYNADIHIDAQYTAPRVSLNDLVSNLSLSSFVMSYRGDVYVIAQLRDKLTQPDIKFKLDFPQQSPVKSDNEFSQYLKRLEKDQNEILNQVAFLILFDSFAPASGAGTSTGVNPYSIQSLTANSISGALTKSVNKVVSNLLFKLTGDKSLRFDVGASIYSSTNAINQSGGFNGSNNEDSKLDRTRVDLKLAYAFANDKIVVTLGSDIDFSLGSSNIQNGNVQWLPNLNIEFILTKDKMLRLIVFNKNSLDLSGSSFGRRNRQGVSISYRKEFETIFGKKENNIEFKSPTDTTVTKGN